MEGRGRGVAPCCGWGFVVVVGAAEGRAERARLEGFIDFMVVCLGLVVNYGELLGSGRVELRERVGDAGARATERARIV